MATVIVTAGQAGKAGQASRAPVVLIPPRASQVITSSASNAVSTVKLSAGEVAMVTASGGAIRIATATGADPNAATGAQYLLGDGGAFPFEALADDTRIAVADL